MEDIRVYVVKYKDRDNFAMKYRDPQTGREHKRTTGTNKHRDAERAAAK